MLSSSAEQPLGIGCSVSAGVSYPRREPEKTLFHRLVREHLATFLVEAQDRYPSGELPRFIRAEFERYLRCALFFVETTLRSATRNPKAALLGLPGFPK